MAEEATSQNSASNAEAGKTEETASNSDKTFTQAEVNAIVSKRISAENVKADERNKAAIAEAIKEYDRKAKLTEEERLKEERKAKDNALAEKERNITMRENRADAIEELAKRQLDTSLVDFVVDIDGDKTTENIDKLEKAFNSAVSKSVEAKLTGKTPEDYGTGDKKEGKESLTSHGYTRGTITAF